MDERDPRRGEPRTPDPEPGTRPRGFRRHPFLSYQGYAFPWYATVLWLSFFIGGILYFVRNVLIR